MTSLQKEPTEREEGQCLRCCPPQALLVNYTSWYLSSSPPRHGVGMKLNQQFQEGCVLVLEAQFLPPKAGMWVREALLSWHSQTTPASLKQPHLSFALMVYDPPPFPSSIHPHPQAYYQQNVEMWKQQSLHRAFFWCSKFNLLSSWQWQGTRRGPEKHRDHLHTRQHRLSCCSLTND